MRRCISKAISTPQTRSEIVQAATLHGKIIARRGAELEQVELVMAPCLLERTAAEDPGGDLNRERIFVV